MTYSREADRTSLPNCKSTASPPRGRTWLFFAVALFAAMVLVAAFVAGLLPRLRQREALRRITGELAIPVVAVVSPESSAAADGLLLTAEVKPWIETPIYARASGYLKRRFVDLGDRVNANQLLGEIDTPELDQELERARHELAEAEAALALAKKRAERSAKLVERGGISEAEYDEDQADVKVKTATVNAARASVHRLEELHSFTRVTAPFSGIITARKTDVGDLIAAGSGKELFRLAQVDRLRVRVHVPQSQALAIAPGQTAELLVPELPGKVFTAKVDRTAGAISPDSRTLLTELEVDNTRGELLSGCFAQVRLTNTKGEGALTLPSNTLLFRAEGPQVGVVQADGVVRLRSVKLGRDFGKTVEILAGVGPADRVILNPSDSLIDGTVVRIKAEKGGR